MLLPTELGSEDGPSVDLLVLLRSVSCESCRVTFFSGLGPFVTSVASLVRLTSPFDTRVEVLVRSGLTPPLVRCSPPAWLDLDDDALC